MSDSDVDGSTNTGCQVVILKEVPTHDVTGCQVVMLMEVPTQDVR